MRISDINPGEVTDAITVRSYLIDSLRRELVGPDPGHPFVQWSANSDGRLGEEVLRPQDPPRFRYACGILFPNGVRYSGSQDPPLSAIEAEAVDKFSDAMEAADEPPSDEDASEDGERGEAERTIERDAEPDAEPASFFLPSTMGLSFFLKGEGSLFVTAHWATYEPLEVPGYARSGGERVQQSRADKVWFRKPRSAPIELTQADLISELEIKTLRKALTAPGEVPSVELDVVSRKWLGGCLVTITLMNTTPHEGDINQSSCFQCGLKVMAGPHAVIERYPEGNESSLNSEELKLKLLYRHHPIYAHGHGCAADWTSDADGALKELRTEVLPVFQQYPIMPRDRTGSSKTEAKPALSMRQLSEADRDYVVKACKDLASDYTAWIEDKRTEAASDGSLTPALRAAADSNLASCAECRDRIERGIEILRTNNLALDAFKLMNRAMLEQRFHYALGANDKLRRTWKKGDAGQQTSSDFSVPTYDYATQWRPFQLAFIVMNLASFTDIRSAERNLADVIWFPTGGGKTEAYLGLIAFVILLRRMLDKNNAGTTALMRYTLRLLTTQQFQRAASLICALELIRRQQPDRFGDEPITIGLWLGGGVTPNRNQQAVDEWTKLARGESENKFVVLTCPWCGVDMGPREYGGGLRIFGYEKTSRPSQVRFRCEDTACPFSSDAGLPLEVVDERIYHRPPTLVVGTVDKFAMLPWEPKSRSLFGREQGHEHDPPDIIIQDELHLISGPLGSMVGHYETVIDALCTRAVGSDVVGPKIVASTATIARAEEQVTATFARAARLFPPQGLQAGESFFAEERRDLIGRAYVGVFATALPSHVTAQVFTIAALLQSPALLQPPVLAEPVGADSRDPYWTLMAYFNSLRELGRAATLVQADIRERLNAVWDRIGLTILMENQGKSGKALRRFINRHEELTSRVRSGDIPGILQKLFTSYPADDVIDLCLATNMIQVGLDVPRLSLMTIVGQPKTASEYIQASSRVGRATDRPGLVVTNFNPFKPRDRSHFESFRSFHESIYRYVEPTSVTPFSIPVCERAIHALAVALARTLDQTVTDSPQSGLPAATQTTIENIIRQRVQKVAPDELESAMNFLKIFLNDWNRVRPQYYGSFNQSPPPGVEPMLWPVGRARPDHTWTIARDTPSSMRNVDADCEAWSLKEYPGAREE